MTYRPAFYELVIIRSIDTALSAPHPHPVRPYWWRVWWLGLVWLCSVAQQVQMTLRVSTTEDNTLLCGNRLPVCVCESTSFARPWEPCSRGNGYITLESLCYLFVALYLFGAIRWSMNFILIMYKMPDGRHTASPLSCKDHFVYSREMTFAYRENHWILIVQNLWFDVHSTVVI